MAVVKINVEVLVEGFHITAVHDDGKADRYSADTRTGVLRRVARLLGINPGNITARELRGAQRNGPNT